MMTQTGVIPSLVGWHETADLHRYFVCDVFTSEPLQGNQLGVFTDGRPFSQAQMQRLAREMNFPETGDRDKITSVEVVGAALIVAEGHFRITQQ